MNRLAAVVLLAAPALAQAQQLDIQSTIARVVDNVARVAEQSYVFPDTGRMVADHLRKRLKEGVYRQVTEPAQLADRLTTDMQAINGDRHLYVTFAGRSPAGSAPAPQMVRRRPGETPSADQLTWPRRLNYDFNEVRRLAGNVGYVSLFQLSSRGTDESYAALDAAMAFLQHTDAIIIDLRRTAGGDIRMSDYFASYFFDVSVPTLSGYNRSSDQTFHRTTGAVKGTKRPDVPVFVLVGPGTASGTEDFSFTMKQTGRGTLVGGKTAGAGRLTAIYPVGDGFSASVSGGRTFDPRTGAEWERVGIQPHVAASDGDALTVAHAAALEKVAAKTSDAAWKTALTWTRTVVLARARPVSVAATILREYAGDYDARRVRLENGKLWYQRDATRLAEELTAIDANTFALGEATRVEFVRDAGRVTAMKLTNPLGQESIYPRTR